MTVASKWRVRPARTIFLRPTQSAIGRKMIEEVRKPAKKKVPSKCKDSEDSQAARKLITQLIRDWLGEVG